MWLFLMVVGAAWVAFVGWFLTGFFDFADTAASDGAINELTTPRIALALLSSLIFAMPGIGAMLVGWRKRPRRG